MDSQKKPLPIWTQVALTVAAGSAIVSGAQSLSRNAPIHFGVVGQAPAVSEGWACAPEGGIVGAPLVCRPTAELLQTFETAAATAVETK